MSVSWSRYMHEIIRMPATMYMVYKHLLTSYQVITLIDINSDDGKDVERIPGIGIRYMGRDIAEFYDFDYQYFAEYWLPMGEMSVESVINAYATAYKMNGSRHGSVGSLAAIRDIVEGHLSVSIPDNMGRIQYLKDLIYIKGFNTEFLEDMLDYVISAECLMRLKDKKARVIQGVYRRAIADPSIMLCYNRLQREAMELMGEI